MIRVYFSLIFLLFVARPAWAGEAIPQDQTAAVIIAYQHIGQDENGGATIDPDQFAAHVEELKDGNYHVLPLPQIIAALKKGTSLPPHTVALTFDGANKSLLKNALPLLEQAHFPFTIFVATDPLDGNAPDDMRWADLKRLARNPLVTIGLEPASITPMTASTPEEVRRQINKARTRLRDMAGVNAALFVYPFGQYRAADKAIVADSGFDAAFGLQSGVAYAGADLYSLPRFIMTDDFGDLERFQMAANALPLPVKDIDPKAPSPSSSSIVAPRPDIGFTVDPALASSLKQLNCFVSGQSKPVIERLGANRVEIRLQHDLDDGNVRMNCTLPGPAADVDEVQRWRWFGMLLSPAAGDDKDADQPEEATDTSGD